jgi:predicted GH43/DUF377 family glycosyl hydrolase
LFRWQKLRNISLPESTYSWMVSHAANPVPVILDFATSIVRIYFTCRDASNRSHVAFADLDFANDFKVIKVSDAPIISPGLPGEFDDSGAAMGDFYSSGDRNFIYYLGWNLKVTVPWQNSIGLAVSESGEPFRKISRAPILDRSETDPYSISYPSILKENGVLRMWYGSNLNWGSQQHEMNHVIKYAESTDGIHWNPTGRICIDLEHPGEYALSKPCVLKINDKYCMWYSYRASAGFKNYKIGYAQSSNGLDWQRHDNLAGIDVSTDGWDSEMICYPAVFILHGNYYMLYNGNGYGKTGFGIAKALGHL